MEDQQLPVQYTVVSALKLVRANWLTLLFLSAPFCVVNSYFVLGWVDISEPQVIFTPLNMLIGLLYLATAAMAAVRIHRLALLDEKSCSLGAIFHISIREWRFVGWWGYWRVLCLVRCLSLCFWSGHLQVLLVLHNGCYSL
ncbi:hypothetical protein P4S52_04240 [Vibrio sp. SA48]